MVQLNMASGCCAGPAEYICVLLMQPEGPLMVSGPAICLACTVSCMAGELHIGCPVRLCESDKVYSPEPPQVTVMELPVPVVGVPPVTVQFSTVPEADVWPK